MRWPWVRHPEPKPDPVVTPEDRRHLEELETELAARRRQMDARMKETTEQAGYLREEKERNHLADRFRAAFEGR